RPPTSTLLPYTTLFRSRSVGIPRGAVLRPRGRRDPAAGGTFLRGWQATGAGLAARHVCAFALTKKEWGRCRTSRPSMSGERRLRSEEHTSELQSRFDLV